MFVPVTAPPAPAMSTAHTFSMLDEHAFRFEGLSNLANVMLEFSVLVNFSPLPRAWNIDSQIKIDAPRTRRHDDDSIGEKHHFVDSVRDEEDRIAHPTPHQLQIHNHLLASEGIECPKGLV